MDYDHFSDGMFDYSKMTGFNELSDKVGIYFAEKTILLRNMRRIS